MMLFTMLMMHAPVEAPLPGVWSLGAERRCDAGEAWVFTADGYYVEVDLPSLPIHAVGVFTDNGDAIEYTHAHIPFPQATVAQERRVLKVTARTSDRIDTVNYKGEARVFHRCPADALKKPASGE